MTGLTLQAAALLLDMDGTLVHSTTEVETVWRLWCRRHRLDPDPILAACHGVRSFEVIQALAPDLDLAREIALLDEMEIQHTGAAEPLAGCRAVLQGLPMTRWALVTSASRRVALHRLASAGLPVPLQLIGAAEVARGKPDPELPTAWCLRMRWLEYRVLSERVAGSCRSVEIARSILRWRPECGIGGR
jgi:mannitol-1-/sugar-/sorbitol-6-phosphatase